MSDPRNLGERPEGPGFSPILYDMQQQITAARHHGLAEGADVDSLEVLESYDRQLHPWLHGRRPADIARRIREWWS